MSNPEKGNWWVTMKCVVTKDVYCVDCTEEEARKEPFEHAEDEIETEQYDYDVRKVVRAD